MTGAGDLDRRIQLQSAVIVNDPDYNSPKPIWTTYATVWAGQEFLSSTESEAASRQYAEFGLFFTIRYPRTPRPSQCLPVTRPAG
ncbi:MAG: head-tail adaptor protein [Mesorhizobium sp.]|nr:MAG: head-tail adaptor protein [Mesorhizobium sp.]